MKYIIIGLGDYGFALADELATVGHEVIGVDNKPTHIEPLKEKLAIGENFGVSVRVTALLKQMKVEHIFARANDEVHRSVMQAFGIEKILSPEADAAHDLVEIIEFGYDIETYHVDKDHAVVKFIVPSKLIGYSVPQLRLAEEFGLKLIATIRGKVKKNTLGINYTERNVLVDVPDDLALEEGDQLVIFGKFSSFRRFWNAL